MGSIPVGVTRKSEAKRLFCLAFCSKSIVFLIFAPILPQSILYQNKVVSVLLHRRAVFYFKNVDNLCLRW